jgi:hypothetical protein
MVRILYDFIRYLHLIQKINKKKYGNVKSFINFANIITHYKMIKIFNKFIERVKNSSKLWCSSVRHPLIFHITHYGKRHI